MKTYLQKKYGILEGFEYALQGEQNRLLFNKIYAAEHDETVFNITSIYLFFFRIYTATAINANKT